MDAINLDKTSSSVKIERTVMKPGKINKAIPSPYTAPQTKILFLNADQMTAEKKLELSSYVKRERPLIMAVCEVKPKNSAKKLTEED